MEENLKAPKTEIIEWIDSLDGEAMIFEILRLKNNIYISGVAGKKSTYAVDDDFIKRFAEGTTLGEARKKSLTMHENGGANSFLSFFSCSAG